MRVEHRRAGGAASRRSRTDPDDLQVDDELDVLGEDDLDDELLDEELEMARLDPTRPTEHQLAGGAPRGLGWLLALGGAIGALAAMMLILSERAVLLDPEANLACNLNPLIGCGDFIMSWQGSVLGPPNALLGLMGFTAVATTGVVLLGGARLPRWYWLGLMAGTVVGAVVITWFQFQSMAVLRGLCPYCMVVWAVTIPIVVQVWARGLQAGHLRVPEGVRRFVVQERWLLIGAWFLLLVALIVVVFWNQWQLVF